MKFGAISYFPDEVTKREKRKKVALQCIKKLSEAASIVNEPLHVVTTNWSEKDFNDFRECCKTELMFYTVPNESRSCGRSRNILLNLLYDSSDDYMLISDDDGLLTVNDEFKEFISFIHNNPESFYSQDIFMMLSSSCVYPINLFVPHHKTSMWEFEYKNPIQLGSPTIHPNTRKHFNKDILIPEFALLPENSEFREDIYRYIEAIKLGTTPMFCKSFKSRVIDQISGSTIWNNGMECRQSTKKQLAKYYPEARYDDIGGVDAWSYLSRKCHTKMSIPKLFND